MQFVIKNNNTMDKVDFTFNAVTKEDALKKLEKFLDLAFSDSISWGTTLSIAPLNINQLSTEQLSGLNIGAITNTPSSLLSTYTRTSL
ncbi:MAG: hypothetical protein EB127_00535 [Alphaproteobacteria bacterium]|nr:hypothetical protein [Alphaproteobacteria bacterium]